MKPSTSGDSFQSTSKDVVQGQKTIYVIFSSLESI